LAIKSDQLVTSARNKDIDPFMIQDPSDHGSTKRKTPKQDPESARNIKQRQRKKSRLHFDFPKPGRNRTENRPMKRFSSILGMEEGSPAVVENQFFQSLSKMNLPLEEKRKIFFQFQDEQEKAADTIQTTLGNIMYYKSIVGKRREESFVELEEERRKWRQPDEKVEDSNMKFLRTTRS